MKKFVIIFLGIAVGIGFTVPVFPVKQVKAQAVVPVISPSSDAILAKVLAAGVASATATAQLVASVGVVGTGDLTISAVRSSLGAVCEKVLATYDVSSAVSATLDTSANSALTLIGGGAAEYGNLTSKLAKAIAAKQCVDGYVKALSGPKPTLQQAQAFQPELDKYTKISNTLQTSIEDITAQQKASVKDILKAFMVKVILNLNKTLTTELVNKMIEKYKISDYLAYGDAVASQIYSMKYINENYAGDARTALMIRSMMQSEKIPGKVNTVIAMANSEAQRYVGTVCPNTSQDTASYWMTCVAGMGSKYSDPNWVINNTVDATNAAIGAGQKASAQEVSQSTGYAPPRNCSGSIQQQQQIDNELDVAATNLSNAQAVLDSLTKSKTLYNQDPTKYPNVSDEDLAEALSAKTQAQTEYDNLLGKFNAGGSVDANGKPITDPVTGKVKNGAIIDICEAITSPASFIANSLGDFLKSHLEQSSQLKSENLPFYASFLADVTSNFLTNILIGNKSTAQVFKEAGAGAMNGGLIALSEKAQNSNTPPAVPCIVGKNVSAFIEGTNQALSNLTSGTVYNYLIDFRESLSKIPAGTQNTNIAIGVTGLPGYTQTQVFTPTPEQLSSGLMPIRVSAPTPKVPFNVTVLIEQNDPRQNLAAYCGTFYVDGVKPIANNSNGTVSGAVTTVSSASIMPRGPQVSFR